MTSSQLVLGAADCHTGDPADRKWLTVAGIFRPRRAQRPAASAIAALVVNETMRHETKTKYSDPETGHNRNSRVQEPSLQNILQ